MAKHRESQKQQLYSLIAEKKTESERFGVSTTHVHSHDAHVTLRLTPQCVYIISRALSSD